MEKQVIELLMQMRKEMNEGFARMDKQFEKVESDISEIKELVTGVGHHFELTHQNKDEDVAKLGERLEKVESSLFRLTNN